MVDTLKLTDTLRDTVRVAFYLADSLAKANESPNWAEQWQVFVGALAAFLTLLALWITWKQMHRDSLDKRNEMRLLTAQIALTNSIRVTDVRPIMHLIFLEIEGTRLKVRLVNGGGTAHNFSLFADVEDSDTDYQWYYLLLDPIPKGSKFDVNIDLQFVKSHMEGERYLEGGFFFQDVDNRQYNQAFFLDTQRPYLEVDPFPKAVTDEYAPPITSEDDPIPF